MKINISASNLTIIEDLAVELARGIKQSDDFNL